MTYVYAITVKWRCLESDRIYFLWGFQHQLGKVAISYLWGQSGHSLCKDGYISNKVMI